MLIIRATKSLFKRMKVSAVDTKELSTGKLGDWYAVDIVLQRKQFILCMSQVSRLAVVIEAAPYTTFPYRLCDAIIAILKFIGVKSEKIKAEQIEMDTLLLGKTMDRSTLGSMNEYRRHLEYMAEEGRVNLNDPRSVSEVMTYLGSSLLEEFYPMDAALKLFGQEPPSRRSVHASLPKLSLVNSENTED